MNKKLNILFLFLSVMIFAQQKPTLFLIGDSTMADKENPEKNPEHGWGQMLPIVMTSGIVIQNHATNGRSSKSFRTEGRWDKVMKQLKKGDFVIIQFGHNDQKVNDSSRFTNPYTQYRANLERYVNEIRAKGAIPILMTSIVRRNFNENGVLVDTHKEYPLVVRMVANDLKVDFVDLQLLTEQMEISYGPEKSKKLHLHFAEGENPYYPKGKDDDTHLSKLGAETVAKLAANSLKNLNIGLEKYIK
ncbi:Lysophospholipase L1 [Chryseobacterium taeanense]|uniref:Lysophospholipase L1 n=1 Tax=Chryseobacterium taeanense TaxID=311334 RepID=A0A1G8DVD3_9FLAO|nr:rhamnogalacturonan acetylesterase [Chryseobacterium taeanense]SDH61369.1 Lysophospholipase L1 [Chryseobacterium taeanense]